MKKNLLYAGVALAALMPLAAYAADAPKYADAPEYADPAARWDGMYIGALIGWADGDADVDYTKMSKGAKKCSKTKDCVAGSVNLDGFFGGATIGYNHQNSNGLVFGIEADIVGADINGTEESPFIYSGSSKAVKNLADVDIDLAGTVRARLGFAAGPQKNTLLYGTIGGAWATHTATFQQDKYTGCSTFDCDENDKKTKPEKYVSRDGALFGLAVGVGVEHAVNQHWSVKAEYLFTDYMVDTTTGDKFEFETDIQVHSFRIGINRVIGMN